MKGFKIFLSKAKKNTYALSDGEAKKVLSDEAKEFTFR